MPASKAQQAMTAERRTKALELRTAGLTLEQIAERLGYADRQSAGKDIDRALAVRRQSLDETADNLRPLEAERLDALERAAWEVLNRPHMVMQHGHVVKDEKGKPIADDGPVLEAIDRLLKIQARRARLFGLDAPTKSQQEVTHVDLYASEIARLVADMAAGGTGPAAGHPEVLPVAGESPA